VSTLRSFYEVIVVGASLAALSTGALLARRGFRVAVLGQGARQSVYDYEGLPLRRDMACVDYLSAPVFQRIMTELALLPAIRRRAQTHDPAWQVVLPRQRLAVYDDTVRRLAELDRVFPEVHRPVEDFYTNLELSNGLLDKVFASDAPWPPDGFFKRQIIRRNASETPFGSDGLKGDVLAEFAADHPFRIFVDAQTRFAGGHDPDRMTALARTRLHASALRGVFLSDGGEDGLRALLCERIQQHGGDVRLRDEVDRIEVRGGKVHSVALAGLDESLGCGFVVTSLPTAQARRLVAEPPSRGFATRMLAARPRYFRYVLNVAARAEAVPVAMARRVFCVADLKRPLAEENLLNIECTVPDEQQRVVFTTSALLPRSAVEEGETYLRRVRERVLRSLYTVVPFLDRHTLAVDSPHDGMPLDDREKHITVQLPSRWTGTAEAMVAIDDRGPGSFLGVSGLDCETDIKGLLLVGREVLPGVGTEGEFLTAHHVATKITRTDRSKERMRKEIWSKTET
jgi:hypothetical protein